MYNCPHMHPHLCSEGLLHLLYQLKLKAVEGALTRVAISCESRYGYFYPGMLTYNKPQLVDSLGRKQW